MFRQMVYFGRGVNVSSGLSRLGFGLGMTFICLGLLILVFPQILIAMVSSAFILFGVFLVGISWREKTWKKQTVILDKDY